MHEATAGTALPCACTTLRRGGRALSRLYGEALAPSGLKATQFALLAALERASQLPITALADELVMDRTTLSRNLLPLAKSGLVAIEPGADRRMKVARLTQEGQTRLTDARPLWREAQDQVIGSFGHDRLRALMGELSAIVAAVR